MDGFGFFLLTLSVLHFFTFSHSTNEFPDSCPINARINLTGTIPDASNLVKKSGYVFGPESRWEEHGDMFGCICYDKPCLPLCCPVGMVRANKMCKKSKYNTSAIFPPIDGVPANIQNFHIIESWPCKKPKTAYTMDPMKRANYTFDLMKDGSISVPGTYKPIREISEYCFYRVEEHRDVKHLARYIPLVCNTNGTTHRNTHFSYTKLGMIISIPFLFITLIVYTILPEMKTIHGLTMRGYVGCLLFAYIFRVVIHNPISLSQFMCKFAAHVTLFSFIASFIWLNILGFDIWQTFGCPNFLRRWLNKYEHRRYLIYSIYVWGCAILWTTFCVIMENIPRVSDSILRPEFAVNNTKCWFGNKKATALYFYGPLCFTVICNIFFFISTTAKLYCGARNSSRRLQGPDSAQHNKKKQWLRLYLGLFIIMGVNWMAEILSYYREDAGSWIIYVLNLGNAFQGLFIFIIFVCKKTVLRGIIEYFRTKVPNFRSKNSRRTIAHQNSSQDTCMTTISQS